MASFSALGADALALLADGGDEDQLIRVESVTAREKRARRKAERKAARKADEARQLAAMADTALETIRTSIKYHLREIKPPRHVASPDIWGEIDIPFWLKLLGREVDCAFGNGGKNEGWKGCFRQKAKEPDERCGRMHVCLMCRQADHYALEIEASSGEFRCPHVRALDASGYNVEDDMELLRAAVKKGFSEDTSGWFSEGSVPEDVVPGIFRAPVDESDYESDDESDESDGESGNESDDESAAEADDESNSFDDA